VNRAARRATAPTGIGADGKLEAVENTFEPGALLPQVVGVFYPKTSMVALMALALSGSTLAAEKWTPLFNGHDLAGWDTWLGKTPASVIPTLPKDAKANAAEPIGLNRDPLGVFTVVSVDGQPAIHITGQIFGGMSTKEEYGNYRLRLQFKWGEKKWPPREKPETQRDSGLLYHVHSGWNYNGKTWPRSPELQIQERDIGDLFAIDCQMTVLARRIDPTKRLFQYDPQAGTPTDFLEQPPNGNRCIRLEDYEKPHGEWNTVELVCFGDQSIHIVNGKVVMRLSQARRLDGPTPAPLTRGKILLQSEGAEIYYRNIEVHSIAAVPEEFVEKK
jgi:hypothetical protein